MNRSILLVTCGFLALHLIVAATLPMISDEAYYALWSSALDWDYYDHPPMIAAMIRAGTTVFGMTPFGLRVVPMLAMAGASLLVGATAGKDAGGLAALYFNLGFLVLAVGSFATPDAPSTFFWMLATFAARKATEGEGALRWGQPRWQIGWWALAGLACGLGVMSKFTNLFLMVGFCGWLLFTRAGRASLVKPGPYLAVVCTILPVLPLILWNIAHHGLGFERQFGRIVETGLTPWNLGQYLLMLILLPTPLIGILVLRGMVFWHGKSRALLLWSVAPLLTYFAFHALHGKVELNWPIPAMGALAVLAAVPALGEGWRKAALWSGAALSFGLLALLFNPWQPIGIIDSPSNQIRGWDALPQIAKAAQEAQTGWIATTDYALTGRMFVSFPGTQVRAVTEPQRWGFRGAFPATLCTHPALLVENATNDPALATTLFGEVGPAILLPFTSAGVTLRTYRLRKVSQVLDKSLCP